MICRADFVMDDFVMHDFSVYTGITNRVISFPLAFIYEKRKWRKIILRFRYVSALIIIASTFLRIRLDRRPPRVWARSWICKHARYCAHHSLIEELSSEDPEFVFRGPNREQTTLFQPFLLLTLAFFTPLTDCYEWSCETLLLFFLERH